MGYSPCDHKELDRTERTHTPPGAFCLVPSAQRGSPSPGQSLPRRLLIRYHCPCFQEETEKRKAFLCSPSFVSVLSQGPPSPRPPPHSLRLESALSPFPRPR